MELFEAARKTIRILGEGGFEAWLVGGSVRDYLLGTPPDEIGEFVVATDARPEDVQSLFRRSIPVGKAFGVVRVGVGPHWMEVATFRTESDYEDGRHPSNVAFATAEEDVHRRDFTVNGLLWNPETDEIRDYVGGRADVEQGVIRAIGDPDERFAEDALRLLRAVRFGAWRDFRLDGPTRDAIGRHREHLGAVSAERVREELVKMTERPSSRRGDAWRGLVSTGLAEPVLGFEPREDADATARMMDALSHRDLTLWLAAAARGVEPEGSPPARWRRSGERIAERLRCSTEERARLGALLEGRPRYRALTDRSVVRLRLAATRVDHAVHEDLLRAEGDAANVLSLLATDREVYGGDRPQPLLDGRRLISAGITPGRRLGWLLRKVRVRQLAGSLASTDEALAFLGI